MASMRDIKRRKSSIQGTQQITKAMKLVSTVKLQRGSISANHTEKAANHDMPCRKRRDFVILYK